MNEHHALDALTSPPMVQSTPCFEQSMMSTPVRGENGEPVLLWCDPLTGLVAYPSFAEGLTERLSALAPSGVHLAIGDVDDLKEYVSQRRADDPTHFGHLAGSECMQALGRVTRAWAEHALVSWPFAMCGTFGGDEVIIAAAGRSYDEFVVQIRRLMQDIAESVPRTCSFSSGTLTAGNLTAADQERADRQFVSQVDAALFGRKARLRAAHINPRGDFEDVGAVVFEPAMHGATAAPPPASEPDKPGSD